MKQPERVAELLAELRALAENDFERHRIDVLERDLHEPPTVEVIDDTHQRFNGTNYGQTRDQHYKSYGLIHRDVWSYYNGDILANYHIHHIDHNPSNNDISNLQLVTSSEHKRIHWQGTAPKQYICENCGKTFMTKSTSARFCSRTCREIWQWKSGEKGSLYECPICKKKFVPCTPDQVCCSQSCAGKLYWSENRPPAVYKTCPVCGKSFAVPRDHKEQQCCSYSCSANLRWQGKKSPQFEKTCPVCHKSFSTKKESQTCCSKSCAATLNWQKKKP